MPTHPARKPPTRPGVEPMAADPAWEASAWLDPAWARRLGALAHEAEHPPGVDPKLMALVALAIDASPHHLYPQGMRRHTRQALQAGASLDELAAVLRYASLLGQHSLKLGAHILMEELATHHHQTPPTPTKRQAHD